MMLSARVTGFGVLASLIALLLLSTPPAWAATEATQTDEPSSPGLITMKAQILDHLDQVMLEPVFTLYIGQEVELAVTTADQGMDPRLEVITEVMEGDGEFYHVIFKVRDTTPGREWAFEASTYVKADMPARFEIDSVKPEMDRSVILTILDAPGSQVVTQIDDESF
jgi:hypothetical protein